jgi:hypothetical protein
MLSMRETELNLYSVCAERTQYAGNCVKLILSVCKLTKIPVQCGEKGPTQFKLNIVPRTLSIRLTKTYIFFNGAF